MDARHDPFAAAVAFGRANGFDVSTAVVLKDGSNLLVHLAPAPVVIRVATFTAAIRTDPWPYLAREVALLTWLAAAGAPVMVPSDLVPPGPTMVDGWAMTAWRYVDHEVGAVPPPAVALAALDDLLAAMRGYPGSLPLLNPVGDDLDRAIAYGRRHGVFGATEATDLAARRDELRAAVLAGSPDRQALHGDAFPRNSLVTAHGVVWIDFEDTCAGPVIWDLATLVRSTRDAGVRALVVGRVGEERLRDAHALRDLQAEVWGRLHEARDRSLVDADPAGPRRPA